MVRHVMRSAITSLSVYSARHVASHTSGAMRNDWFTGREAIGFRLPSMLHTFRM